MNEQELRLLVRAAVARHIGTSAAPAAENVGRGFLTAEALAKAVSRATDRGTEAVPLHVFSSQTLYTGLVNVGDDCVIEPAVKCDHCGFCKSHGY